MMEDLEAELYEDVALDVDVSDAADLEDFEDEDEDFDGDDWSEWDEREYLAERQAAYDDEWGDLAYDLPSYEY